MMKLQSFRDLSVTQREAWNFLNDLEVLKRCIPGCQSLEREADGSLSATVVAKIGPVSAKFGGKVAFEDVIEPVSYRLIFSGQGGAAGFAKGQAHVQLEVIEGGTKLNYTSEAAIGGKLAQIGSRLVEASARKIADDFFSRLDEEIHAAQKPSMSADGSAELSRNVTIVNSGDTENLKGSAQPNWLRWIGAVGGAAILAATAYLYFH